MTKIVNQQPSDQPESAPPAEPGASPTPQDVPTHRQAHGLFVPERRQAESADSRWQSLQDNLDETLSSADPCGSEAQQALTETKDAALRALALKAAYLQAMAGYWSQRLRSGG